jgi:hypothetical protein
MTVMTRCEIGTRCVDLAGVDCACRGGGGAERDPTSDLSPELRPAEDRRGGPASGRVGSGRSGSDHGTPVGLLGSLSRFVGVCARLLVWVRRPAFSKISFAVHKVGPTGSLLRNVARIYPSTLGC